MDKPLCAIVNAGMRAQCTALLLINARAYLPTHVLWAQCRPYGHAWPPRRHGGTFATQETCDCVREKVAPWLPI